MDTLTVPRKQGKRVPVGRRSKNGSVTLKKKKRAFQLDYAKLREAVMVLRAVNHKLRLKIIDLLQDEGEPMTVTDIYIRLRLEQSVASQHLAILKKAGVLETDRQGKFIYYSIVNDRLRTIDNVVTQLAA